MNWISITADYLKAAGHGDIIDQARTLATGAIDPVDEQIAGATARVRRAIAPANALDVDPTKVPNSLREVTIRIALYALMERIGLPLTQDQRDTRRDDASDLNRLADKRIGVEAADNPAQGGGEMQSGKGGVVAVNVPCRQTGRGRTSGL